METFDSAFFLTMATLIIGFLGIAIKYCLKSKCQDFNCLWGMIKIIRRVDLESQIELSEMKNNLNDDDEEKKEESKNII